MFLSKMDLIQGALTFAAAFSATALAWNETTVKQQQFRGLRLGSHSTLPSVSEPSGSQKFKHSPLPIRVVRRRFRTAPRRIDQPHGRFRPTGPTKSRNN